MAAQQFLAEFGHIVNALGGVPQLRELVLAGIQWQKPWLMR